MIRLLAPLPLLLLLAASAGGETAPGYVDVTATHVPRAPGLRALDATCLDADGDGDLDLALAVEHGPNRLYLNDGRGRLTWRQGAFGEVAHDTEHARAADFDRDGHMDVVFVAEDDRAHQLFLGNGKGGFTDATDRLPARSEGNGLAVGDVNGDGLPDILVGNSGTLEVAGRTVPARNFLWLNDPARPGHFRDATATHLPDRADEAEGLALADMDGDGDLDLLVASWRGWNRLLLNDGTGRFADASDRLDLPVPLHTREVHVLDANRDGRPDILYFNITSNAGRWEKDPQARLLIADGQGRWRDETAQRLPAHRFSTYGGTIVDLDADGAPDIIASAVQIPGFTPQQLRAWRNDGTGRFVDVTPAAIPASAIGRSWSIARCDLDGDGRDDLFIGQWGTQARLLLTAGRAALAPRR